MVVAGLAAWWRFAVDFSLDWALLITGVLLVTMMATAVGYAIAVTLPAMLAQVVSQVMVFFALMFSPVTFPVERLPDWYAQVHEILPVMPAGDVIRAGLVSDTYSVVEPAPYNGIERRCRSVHLTPRPRASRSGSLYFRVRMRFMRQRYRGRSSRWRTIHFPSEEFASGAAA